VESGFRDGIGANPGNGHELTHKFAAPAGEWVIRIIQGQNSDQRRLCIVQEEENQNPLSGTIGDEDASENNVNVVGRRR
jgi:hypothetical protein